ncbi:hypothetical protein [Streptomyces anulatus]|uniref:hypothetical protein n=1 Tax=Streptomyces anulatus TaxID=1892 RepID=UPI0036BC79E6
MIAATLPTLVVLLWAGFWEWPFTEVEYAILAILFGWGTAAGRAGGRDWPASLRTGVLDSLMGVTVIVANVLIK